MAGPSAVSLRYVSGMRMSLVLAVGCGAGTDALKVPVSTDTALTQDSGAYVSADTGEEDVHCDPFGPSAVTATHELDTSTWTNDDTRTEDNPLKGFLTSYLWAEPANDFPDSMEFLYLPMSELWDASGDTFDSGLEPLLDAAESRGHHAILRVYLDYPTRPSGVPGYLSDTVGCSPYAEHGGGCSPNYEHPDLKAAILGLIGALGERYDGDPRLGFVQVGLLGFWGEWHTWPHAEMFPSEDMQIEVLDAFVEAFSITHLQLRRPAVHSVDLRIGFHDDSFAHSTLGDIDWFFWPGMISAGADERWHEVPIGGELRPELQTDVFDDAYVLGTYAQDVAICVETTHASYLLNYWAYNGDGTGYLGEERVRAERVARDMGYEFTLTGGSVVLSGLAADGVDGVVSLELAATGVAPFYYALTPVLVDQATGTAISSAGPLPTVLPGDSVTVDFSLSRVPPELLQGPLMVDFTSPIFLDGQKLQLPTITPWTEAGGPTTVAWALGCDGPSGNLRVGAAVSIDDQDCECRCDVDGSLRDAAGDVCL